jgi:O-acetyl-ADP-ribose deacetylase (regulator of RNase III)
MRTSLGNVTLELIEGDITEADADAIVNAANPYLEHGGGVAAAIVRKGGWEIQEESRRYVREHGPVPVGGAAVTGAGRLRAKHVIHAVGPRWGIDPPEKLQEAVINSLRLADELGLRSIAFPAISTGVYGWPYEAAAREMIKAIRKTVNTLKNINKIMIYLYGRDAYNAFMDAFNLLED